jgi:Tol biopolymer transport system component
MRKKKTRLVSIHSNGTQADSGSNSAAISANARYVVFETFAKTLFNNDKNDASDIVIRDRKKGKTKLISKSSSSKRGDGTSSAPSVSANGRFITFESHAKNLVNNDSNGAGDIFVHDRKKKRTTLVSLRSDGTDGGFGDSSRRAQISADGLIVAFESEADLAGSDASGGGWDIYVHNRSTKKTKQVSVSSGGAGGNDASRSPSVSPDGRFIAFQSDADNLVKGDDNGKLDVFIRDRKKSKTKRLSVGINGSEPDGLSSNSSVSAGGRYVAFASRATNLIGSDGNGKGDIFRRGPLR